MKHVINLVWPSWELDCGFVEQDRKGQSQYTYSTYILTQFRGIIPTLFHHSMTRKGFSHVCSFNDQLTGQLVMYNQFQLTF